MSDLDHLRSWTYSILKCEYGWNGCFTTEMRLEETVDAALKLSGCPLNASAKAAVAIKEHGGVFRPRVDGQPNRRVSQ